MHNKLIIVFVLAFLIRLISLNQSLWLDEATTAKVTQLSFGQIFTQFSPTDFHPPLYYLFMKLWAGIFGTSEIALRFPSIFFSLLTGWYVYKIGTVVKDKQTGFWSAAFFLFNPLIVYYSQEARMYLMVTFMLTVSLYYFLVILKAGSHRMTKEVLLFNLFTGLSFLTFYASVFFIVAYYIYILYKRQYRLLSLLLPGFILSLLLVSPLLHLQLLNSRQALSDVKNWSLVLGTVTFKNVLLIPLKFATGRITFVPKIIYYVIGGLWTFMVVLEIIRGSLKQKMLLYFFVVPLLLGLLFSFVTPLLQYFRFIYLIPVMSILVERGANKELSRKFILGMFTLFSLIYLLFPTYHREDWKSLGQFINTEAKHVYMITSASDPVKYYAKNVEIKDIKNISSEKLAKNIIVIPYVTDVHGVNYSPLLMRSRYSKRETVTLRGLTVERWSADP